MSRRAQVLAEAKQALDSFLASRASFRVVHSVAAAGPSAGAAQDENPKTLFILDSSFNPPSIAHLSLATSALNSATADTNKTYPLPHRLLLLFSVHNADKSPAPAAFEQRLAMMMAFAHDMHKQTPLKPAVDVGLTTQPYYSDKSEAIEQHGSYGGQPRHIHLVGYDTFVRIFEPKYYKSHTPPLSALAGFFKHHGLRITLRPQGEWGGNEEQAEFWRRLQRGDMEHDGGKREWADQVEMVHSDEQGVGVSSTRIRQAVADADWTTAKRMCTQGVVGCMQDMEPYGAP